MKLLLPLLAALTLYASDIGWFYDYKEALQEAKAKHKQILVFMSQPGCLSCEYMEENVFVDGEVEAYVNAHFVPLSLSIYDEDVPAHLKERVTPVFHFLDEEGNPVRKKLIGGKTAPFFFTLLKEAHTATPGVR